MSGYERLTIAVLGDLPPAVRRQRDPLPEHMEYRDTGCPDLGIPACRSCPLSVCRHDRGPGQARSELMARQVWALWGAGRDVAEIAAVLDISRRTVSRLMSRDEAGAA